MSLLGIKVLFFFFSSSVFAIPDLISIGVILPSGREDIRRHFELAIHLHNNDREAQFKFDPQIKVLDDIENFHKVHQIICDQFKRRIYAIIVTAAEPSSLHIFRSYANALQIPTLSATSSIPSASIDFLLNIRPSYTRALLDIVSCYKQKNKNILQSIINNYQEDIIYLYDSQLGFLRWQHIFHLSKTNSTLNFILIKRISNRASAIALLDQFQNNFKLTGRNDNKHYVILDCKDRLAKEIIQLHARSKGLNKRNFHYLIINDVNSWGPEWTLQGIAITRFLTKHTSISLTAALVADAVKILVLGFNRLVKKDDFVFASQNDSMRCNGHNRTTPWQSAEKMMRIMRKITIEGITDFISFDKYGNRNNLSVNIIEATGDGEPVHIRTWSEGKGLNVSTCIWREEKQTKYQSKTNYIVTTILDEPYLMKRNDKYVGYCKDLADKIANVINITYTFKLVTDSHYGGPDPNSTFGWDGMVGELLTEEADLAIAPLTITSARERVIAFSKPFMTLGISVMMERPAKQDKSSFYFMKPLSMEIWMSIVFAYIGVSVVLFFVTHFSSYVCCNHDFLQQRLTVYDSLWFSFAALVQQGSETLPQCLSGRIVVSVWWFFALIVVTSYTANLAAFLTVERMETSINSASDLAKQTRVEYGTIEQGSTQEFFKNSQNPIYQRMWEVMKNKRHHVFVKSNDQGAKRVQTSGGTFAFLMESVKNEYINQRKPCNTIKVGPNLDTKGYGIATAHQSPLRDKLDIAVLRLTEDGTLDDLYTKWWRNTGECGRVAERGTHNNELTLGNVAGIFYVLTGGLILASFTALLELFCK